jgi:hypothetical protein
MQAIQDKIDALHMKQLDETRKLSLECGVRKNEAFAARSVAIKEKGPKDFWARVFRAHADFAAELLGPYDTRILEALVDFAVTFKPQGFRIEMRFGPNEYFADEVLWYEEAEGDGAAAEVVPTASGVRWKAGKGPAQEAPPAARDADPWRAAATAAEAAKAGARRERDDDAERGDSFFRFFDSVPAKPQSGGGGGDDDDGDSQGDAEGFGDRDSDVSAVAEWEDMVDERREIARAIVEEVFDDPMCVLSSTSA